MNFRSLFFLILSILSLSANAQIISGGFHQYFENTDTGVGDPLVIKRDTSSTNIWEVGAPQKDVFDSAATLPNAIVTDTVDPYPTKDTSRFHFTFPAKYTNGSHELGLRWEQKLHMGKGRDGGWIEISTDGGNTWQNIFNHPHINRLNGFDPANTDTLPGGSVGFTGIDSTWKTIRLRYSLWLLDVNDPISFRYSFRSDQNQEMDGWMIDNIEVLYVFILGKGEREQERSIGIDPNPTKGPLRIELPKPHQNIRLTIRDLTGRTISDRTFRDTRSFKTVIDASSGMYFVELQLGDSRKEVVKVVKK